MPKLFHKVLSRQTLPLLVAIGAVAAFAVGYLGTVAPAFDLIAQFTLHWLVVALMAVAASFYTRRAYTLLALAIPLSCLIPAAIATWYAAAAPLSLQPLSMSMRTVPAQNGASLPSNTRSGPAQRRFRILSYNIYNLNTDIDAMAEEIARHDADIVALIEFGPNKRELNAHLRKRYPFFKTCEENWDCGVAVFSRLPVEAFTLVHPMDDAGPSLVVAELMLAGRLVTVLATHILSPNHGPRANFIELDHLARRVSRRTMPMVVAGDFNTTIWANAFDNFRRVSGLTHMGELIPTWPVLPLRLPQLGIDHVFASPEFRIVNVTTGNAAGSDHLPLIADIELK